VAFEKLSTDEKEIVLNCMTAIYAGPYIEDWEFQTRLGVSRQELAKVISMYPDLVDEGDDSTVSLGINNSMNEICHGVYIPPQEWQRWFAVSKDHVKRVYAKWYRLNRHSASITT